MYPYLFPFIYVIIGFLVLLFDVGRAKDKSYNTVFNVLYVFLALLVAFRYRTGVDTSSYMGLFDYLPTLDDLSVETFFIVRFQPLYTLLNVVCKSIYDNFVILQIVQAFLFFHSFYILLEKLALKKFYVLFLFFGYVYMAEMSAMRECFGLAFCFYGIIFYLKRKWLLYYLLVFIGFMFHSGMIVFFVLPAFTLFKTLSVKNVIIIVGFTLLIPIVLTTFQGMDVDIMDGAISRSEVTDKSSISLVSILYRVVLLAIIIYYTIIKKNQCEVSFIYIGGIVYVMLDLLGTISLPQMYRFTSHFCVFFYYTINITLKNVNANSIQKLLIVLWIAYSPIAKFYAGITEPAATYCSVFSSESDKRIMKNSTESFGYYNDYFRKNN